MTPADYLSFRDALGQSSGFQSFQYRQIEFLLGNRNRAMVRPHTHRPEIGAQVCQTPNVIPARLANLLVGRGDVQSLGSDGQPVQADELQPFREDDVAHLAAALVHPGDRITGGEVIGRIGSTGLSTGPHLHYEMYRNGANVNPSSVRFVTRAHLSGSQLAAFRSALAQLQRVEPGAALANLEPDPSTAGEPVREIDRIERRQRVS